MAGIKITDLAALKVSEASDYLCIVDVSDTSASAAGTTKKILLGDVSSSGTWEPTLLSFANAINDATIESAKYSRTGSIVTCTILGTLDVDFSGATNGALLFTLPIVSDIYQCIGCVNLITTKICNGIVRTDAENEIYLSSEDTSLIDSAAPFYAIFQYEVV